MCWSSEVALSFSLAEGLVLLYVAWRDSYFDRANAVFHLPLVLQELLQAVLWPHVGDSGETCSASNRGLSFAVAAVVLGVPLYSALVARATQAALQRSYEASASQRLGSGRCAKGHQLEPFETKVLHYFCSVCGKEELPLGTRLLGCRHCDFDSCETCVEAAAALRDCRRLPRWAQFLLGKQPSLWAPSLSEKLKSFTRKLILFTFWLLVGSLLYMHRRIWGQWLPDSVFAGPRCTTRGPRGHQVWPMLVWGEWWWVRLAGTAAYFATGGGFVLIPKPSYIPVALNCLAFVAMALYLAIGDEWGSVWCWLASCLCVLYLVEPMLFQRFRVFDPEVLNSALSDDRRRLLGFWAARMHFQGEMTPWSVLLEYAAKEAHAAGAPPGGIAMAVQRAAMGFGPTADVSVADLTLKGEMPVPPEYRPGRRPDEV